MCKIDFYNKLNDNHSHSHLINVIKQGEFMKILRNILIFSALIFNYIIIAQDLVVEIAKNLMNYQIIAD